MPHSFIGRHPLPGLSGADGWVGALHSYAWSAPFDDVTPTRLVTRYWRPALRSSIYVHCSDAVLGSAGEQAPIADDPDVLPWRPDPRDAAVSALGDLENKAGVNRSCWQRWWEWTLTHDEDESYLTPPKGEHGQIDVNGVSHPAVHDQLSRGWWLVVATRPVGGWWVALHGNARLKPHELQLTLTDVQTLPAEFPPPTAPRRRTR